MKEHFATKDYLFDLPKTSATFVSLLQKHAGATPERQAYVFQEDDAQTSLTYLELHQKAQALGAWLQRHVPQGERALLLCPPGFDYIVALFGCFYAGVIAVPVYPPRTLKSDRTLPRLLGIIADAQPTIVLTTSRLFSAFHSALEHIPALLDMSWFPIDTCPSELAARWSEPHIDDTSIAFLQYTSGSTTAPKGVVVSHGNLLYNEAMIGSAFADVVPSTYVCWLPLYHDMGLIGNVLHTLCLGATCVLMSPMAFIQQPFRWLQAISRYQARVSGGPNFAYDLCVRKISLEQRQQLDLTSWRIAFNGAEPVRASTLEAFSAAFAPCGFRPETFYPCYGLAEASLFVSGGLMTALPISRTFRASALEQHRVLPTLVEEKETLTLVGCGHTWLDQTILIVDPQTQMVCPEDVVGEIWISGPNVARGYWRRPEETARTFQAKLADGRGPFLRTGDLGFLKDHELFITGRIKDLIIIDGRNHYPQDIEFTVEKSHPAIRSGCTAAFAVEIDSKEQLIVVAEIDRTYLRAMNQADAIAPGATEKEQPEQYAALVRRTIKQAIAAEHDVTAHTIVLVKAGSVPKTSSGKIQRHACRNEFLAATLNVWGRE
ncbi:MAG TPA: fatty acyl-AMP ligase [Ktedonobacteraceae bacterium]|nr:fatty acyl-AMP ligase [Ktedonobacteraceae bacterium]